MAVTSAVLISDYVGAGTVGPFPTGFYFILPEDLIVTINGIVKTYGVDFTLTGAGLSAGGNVTFTAAVAVGARVRIMLSPPITQKTVYIENGPFPAKDNEHALDKLTQILLGLNNTVQNSVRPYISVKDPVYNARGDGIADDAAAIQIAIDTLTGMGGGRLIFPKGIYNVSKALNITDAVSLWGEGEYVTTLRTTSAVANLLNITSKGYLEINGFTLTSSVPRTAGWFIDMNDANIINVYIGHCYLAGYFGGIRWAGTSVLDIDQCQFINGVAGAGIGIEIDNGIDLCVRSCLWSAGANTGAGILITNCGDVNLLDLNITKAGTCLHVSPPNGQVAASINAVHCFFDSSVNGMVVDGAGTGAMVRSKFSNCWFGGHTLRGALFNSAGGQTLGVVFEGCEFYGNTTAGLDFFNGAQVRDVIVQGCQFSGNGTGLNTGDNMSLINILGCRFGSVGGFGPNATGLFVGAGTTHFYVTNNFILGNATNVAFNGASGANTVFRNNEGYVTEAHGVATVANGTTSIVVNHTLNSVPVEGEIIAWPTNSIGAAVRWWIDTITATQFTIHTDANPGANVNFGWQAKTRCP